MKEEGVFGGSMLGATFFHAATNAESSVGAADRSAVEKRRTVTGTAGAWPAATARDSKRAALRYIFRHRLRFFPPAVGFCAGRSTEREGFVWTRSRIARDE